MRFPSSYKKVPLDFALGRYLAVEKGVSIMPLSNFCIHESENAIENQIRIAICKDPTMFTNKEMINTFKGL